MGIVKPSLSIRERLSLGAGSLRLRQALKPSRFQQLWRPALAMSAHSQIPPTDLLTVAAVQWRLDPIEDLGSWIQRIDDMFREATRQGASLIVFPEEMTLSLFGLLLGTRTPDDIGDASLIKSLLKALAPVAFDFWQLSMARMSRHYGIITVAGSGITVHQGRLLNVALTFGPDGSLWSRQPKLHLLSLEVLWGMEAGPGLVQQHLGPFGLMTLVCHDATYFESFRMLETRGALVAAVPVADPEAHYSEDKARRGTWARVQETPMLGVVSAGTGHVFGYDFTGRAGIYLPSPLTHESSGVVAESPEAMGEHLLVASADLRTLREYRVSRDRHLVIPSEAWHQRMYGED